MSVFTQVDHDELAGFLDAYAVGRLQHHVGIEAGIENTNYFVTTTQGEYVLTLFESASREDLDYFLALMAHVAERGVASAHPIPTCDQTYLTTLKSKPAALVQRLTGSSVVTPSTVQCEAIGRGLAGLHLATADFALTRSNDRGPAWLERTWQEIDVSLNEADRDLLRNALAAHSLDAATPLPSGVIHADLFRDNALFSGDRLTGMIDFYYAHNGPFVYDLAVTVADWCFDADGNLHAKLAHALLGGYDCVRQLQSCERDCWPAAVRAAAVRFWLSRLYDQQFPRSGALTHSKDPQPFQRIAHFAQHQAGELQSVWP